MIHNSDGMSKKCNSKSLFSSFFSPGFAPYFRMSDNSYNVLGRDIKTYWVRTYSAVMLQLDPSPGFCSAD